MKVTMGKMLARKELNFDRPWRPGHPFRPRRSGLRRWGVRVLFVILVTLIGGYWYLTDSERVRSMAEHYLSRAVGGTVKVSGASLSIFEGLQLDDVKLEVDREQKPDSVLFEAKTLLLHFDPGTILTGHLEAMQIVAVDPHVRLSRNATTREWNFERLIKQEKAEQSKSDQKSALVLPEILLRNAQIDYSEIVNGQCQPLGSMEMAGRLTPAKGDRYTFELQSRGANDGVGPAIRGAVSMGSGQVTASLMNFQFGQDLRMMMPAEVRAWWATHGLQGRVDVPVLTYAPGNEGTPTTFRAEVALKDVTLAIPPAEWMDRNAKCKLQLMKQGANWIRSKAQAGRWWNALNRIVQKRAQEIEPQPIKLEKVAGRFVFTEQGIEIPELKGYVGGNGMGLQGEIKGYSAEAAGGLRLETLAGQCLHVFPSPQYMTWLPGEAVEIFRNFQPQGTCRLSLELKRAKEGGKINFAGDVDVIDGEFQFDEFPYPLRKSRGRIVLGTDPATGKEGLEIIGMKSFGVAGGPNENSMIELNGKVGPFEPGTGVELHIVGKNITADKWLRQAFPREVRKAMTIFGPSNLTRIRNDPKAMAAVSIWDWPRFHGNFAADIVRPVGLYKHWAVKVDIDVDRASGSLKTFPYPMEDVSCRLEIRDGYLDIINAAMKRKDASLRIDGRVSFGDDADPDLTVKALNVPIDRDLKQALPMEQRLWLNKAGLGGKLDIAGRVFLVRKKGEPEVDFDLNLGLHEGTLWRTAAGNAVTGVTGKMRLKPERLDLNEVKGRHGNAELTGRGWIAWPDNQPQAKLNAEAKNLLLDQGLYALLPKDAQSGWDQAKPEGTVDAEMKYGGEVGGKEAGGWELVLHPKSLAVTPQLVPYRLERLQGTVTISDAKVTLANVSGRHGQATVKLNGVGTLGAAPNWTIQLAGENVNVDADFKRALPAAMASMMDKIKLGGTLDFDFPKLIYRQRESQEAGQTTSSDLDFEGRLGMRQVSSNAGMPLTDMTGNLNLAGTVRDGELSEIAGKINVAAMNLAGRKITNFKADVVKPAGRNGVQIGKVQAEVAGGVVAGEVNLVYPDDGPARYALALVLQNADIKQLAGNAGEQINGRLEASVNLEGNWNDTTGRRGRGDVAVAGREMYRIPLVLGLLQITNLSLPLSGPFKEGTAHYNIEGSKVTFEQISLRSDNMLMQGSGWLDFDSKRVKLTFMTDNPRELKLPFVDGLWRGLRRELLEIQINGTIQEPKVSTTSMGTFQTTVDEVFRGGKK